MDPQILLVDEILMFNVRTNKRWGGVGQGKSIWYLLYIYVYMGEKKGKKPD